MVPLKDGCAPYIFLDDTIFKLKTPNIVIVDIYKLVIFISTLLSNDILCNIIIGD
jgi:hypothetical protein